MGLGGAGEDLDAMHQLLHTKLKWKLTERELEHIERVFSMFDVPAVGAIDRKAFPYAMRRLRFADKSKRRGSWASQAVIKEVLSGEFPAYAKGERDLSYLAYVDAVGRAKSELMNSDDAGVNDAANALEQLTLSFGGFLGGGDANKQAAAAATKKKDEGGENFGGGGEDEGASEIWAKSVESVSKKQVAQAASVFQQALKSQTFSTVNGPGRVTRRDLNPVLCALKPGLTDGDVQLLCQFAAVSGRSGVGFTDVVVMVGYAELASHTPGGLAQLASDLAAEAEAKQQAKAASGSNGLGQGGGGGPGGMQGGLFGGLAMMDSLVGHSSALSESALGAARTHLPGSVGQFETSGASGYGFGLGGVFGGDVSDLTATLSNPTAGFLSAESAAKAAAAMAAAGATDLASGAVGMGGAMGAAAGGGSGGGPRKNKRVALKEKAVAEAEAEQLEAEQEVSAAKSKAEEQARSSDKSRGGGGGAAAAAATKAEADAKLRLKAAKSALDPVYKRQLMGNWFSEKSGSQHSGALTSWRSNLKQVFEHFDSNSDGLLTQGQFLQCVDELELDLDDEEAVAKFREVDVDGSNELSLDEFERFFETLVKEWRANEEEEEETITTTGNGGGGSGGLKIQEQYKPLLTLYEPDEGIFGNNGDGPRKGFLLLMARNGHSFWSDKSLGEAQAAGHWAARLGFDDAREAFELAAAYQTDGNFVKGATGTKVSRLALLRFVRAHTPEGGSLTDSDFQALVWHKHVVAPLSSPEGAANKNVADDGGGGGGGGEGGGGLEMDLSSFRTFCGDSGVVRHFHGQAKDKKQAQKAKQQQASGGGSSTAATASSAFGSMFGSGGGGLFGGGGLDGASSLGGGGFNTNGEGEGVVDEESIREAFQAVDLDGSGDLDVEEVTLLLTAELNLPLSEDEIHALFLRHDTLLKESLTLQGFQALMKDATALLSVSPEEREQELLGWGSRVDKEQEALKQQRKHARKAAGLEEAKEDAAPREARDAWRQLHRKASRSELSSNTQAADKAELAGLKAEMEARLYGVDGQPATGTKGMHNKDDADGDGDDGLNEGGSDAGWGDDDGDGDAFDGFNADQTLKQEKERVLIREMDKAASDALAATKLSVGAGNNNGNGGGNGNGKKAFSDIEADLDVDLMGELKSIYDKCLNSADAEGLDVDGFVLAMKELRLDLPDWRVKETFEEYDDDGNGSLDFEEFVELAAMKLVEKWTAKGGKAFAGGGSSSAVVQTNARRSLSVGEIMGEVMDNKKNADYDRAKAKFHVEEVLLIEEAFITLAEPHSRRGKVRALDLGRLCLCMGMNAREHDLAVLAQEADPLNTRYLELPLLIIALANKPHIWKKVDGQLSDFRADQEVLSEEVVGLVNKVFRRALRHTKMQVSGGTPLMESKLVPACFRLLGYVLEPGLANLWVMELLLGHDAASDAAHAEAVVYEYAEEAHTRLEEKRAQAADPSLVKLEVEPEDVSSCRLESSAAKKARRWICFGDLLNLVGRYLHDTLEVEEEVVTVTKTGILDLEVKRSSFVTKSVARARTVQQEEASETKDARNVSVASSYHLAFDTIMMAESLFVAVDKEKSGSVAAYQLKIMFRRLSWRIGVKPSALQIDELVKELGFAVKGSTAVTLYDWLFMLEFVSTHAKEDTFFGQYGRAIKAFGFMDEGNEEDEVEGWELPPQSGVFSDTMSTVKVQGLDTAKEKVKVRSVKRMDSYKRMDKVPVPDTKGDGDEDGAGWQGGADKEEGGSSDEEDDEENEDTPLVFPTEKEELESLMAKGSDLTVEDKARVKELMQFSAAEDEIAALMAKGPQAMTPADSSRVKELMTQAAVWAKKRKERQRRLQADHDHGKNKNKTPAKGKLRPPSFDEKEKEEEKEVGNVEDGEDNEAVAGSAMEAGGNDEDEEDDEEDEEEEVSNAFARTEALRANLAAETNADRLASQQFAQYSTPGRNGAPADSHTEGYICGQRVLVQALGGCGLDPSKDLRVALLVDSFIQAVLSLPENVQLKEEGGSGVGGGGAGSVLVGRTQFLRLIEQSRRFGPRQRRVRREDLEPEEIFVISDPLALGFVTMKKCKRIVSSMGLSLHQDPRVAAQLLRLGRECAEDNYVVTYDRFIVFVERLRQELQGLGVASVLDVDLANEQRRAAKDLKSTRRTMADMARKAVGGDKGGDGGLGGASQKKPGHHGEEGGASGGASGGGSGDKDYVAGLKKLLAQTDNWESKAPAERERALNLLRVHQLEADKRKQQEGKAGAALEAKIHTLHDRAMRQTAYAKEYATDQLKAEQAGVPPTPRAPNRPKEPALTSSVLTELASRRAVAEAAAKRSSDLDQAAHQFRTINGIPSEPTHLPVPGAAVFNKQGYLKEVKERAEGLKKAFELEAKAWDPYSVDPSARQGLEGAAKKAIRVYLQVSALEKVPSAPTYQIGLIHKRLGNLREALECFEAVIEVDPNGRFADTGMAWDNKGLLLQQLSVASTSECAFCFAQALALRPTDTLIKRHLRECEVKVNKAKTAGGKLFGVESESSVGGSGAESGGGGSKGKKQKKKKGGTHL